MVHIDFKSFVVQMVLLNFENKNNGCQFEIIRSSSVRGALTTLNYMLLPYYATLKHASQAKTRCIIENLKTNGTVRDDQHQSRTQTTLKLKKTFFTLRILKEVGFFLSEFYR